MAKKKPGKRARPILTKGIKAGDPTLKQLPPLEISGWLDGPRNTYLWIGQQGGGCYGTLHGSELYKLAAAIVAEFE